MKPLLLCFLTSLAAEPCIPVDRDRILAADLAPRVAEFGNLDRAIVVALTPFPGVTRTFSHRELVTIARHNQVVITGGPHEVCVVRSLAPLSIDRIRAAITSTLGNTAFNLDIVDFTREPMPSGEIIFSRTGLTPPPLRGDAPALWRGLLRYGPGHSFGIWARVRISEDANVIIVVRNVRRGQEISVGDTTVVARRVFPFTSRFESVEQARGMLARKDIAAGTILTPALLDAAPDIRSGETVNVVVEEGLARVSFDAIALSSGRIGSRVLLRNPQNQTSFRAFVEGKGRARTGRGAGI